ncbi:developmental and secondary metabolism regulator VEL1-like [Anopheles stephensi]|uniref:developmental and secondary metabolism regulator VEL1-like n=1 Tax=Anopheles stephensi TaxID=30069 RepID=UPI001658A91D|nr:developmental and secondary metabolism regulator VEL1-like [Anopheles stephensi]
MKQNSAKPTTTDPSKGTRPSMQRGHHQQTPAMSHQQQMQPGPVTYHQQQQPAYPSSPQQHQQQPGCVVLPTATTMPYHKPQHTYMMPQQSGHQLVNAGTAEAPIYVGGSVMGQQTAQQALPPAGFATAAQQQQQPRYLQTVPHQPSMSQQVQRPTFQPSVTDFVASGGAGPAVGFSGAHQPYKHHQHQAQPMQSYQEAPTTSYPVHVQSSLHPEGPTTTEAQYFFDANCTMPVVQQQNPATLTGCRNPKCTSCKSFKRN